MIIEDKEIVTDEYGNITMKANILVSDPLYNSREEAIEEISKSMSSSEVLEIIQSHKVES